MDILKDFMEGIPTLNTPTQTQQVEFKPSAKKGQNGTYQAIIKFLPNPDDPNNKTLLTKYTCWLTHPTTNTRKEIDCPSSIGEQDPLQTTFFNLRNSSNPILK